MKVRSLGEEMQPPVMSSPASREAGEDGKQGIQ